MPVLEVRNVSKKFGGVVALDSVSHTVDEGEIHVFLGPNGSGKSTLLKIICGVAKPDSGEVLVFGRDPVASPEVKSLIGYAPQENLLFEDLTGFENAMLYARINGVSPCEARKRIREIAEALGIGDWFFKRRVSTYSGGMARKASIATALVHDPKLVVLDEPTSGLDPNARRELWSFISSLKLKGKTIVIASHLFEDAEILADKVIIVYKGKKVAEGSVAELKTKVPCKYSVEVEFVSEPPREVVDRLSEISVSGTVLSYGVRYRVYVNDPKDLEKVQSVVDSCGVKAIRVQLRSIALDDVYFMLTGSVLEG